MAIKYFTHIATFFLGPSFFSKIKTLLLFFMWYLIVPAQFVAPLKLGNSWIHEYSSYYQKQTIIDTNVVIDSLTYYRIKIQSTFAMEGYSEYVRLNTDSFYVWRQCPQPGNCYEEPYYKQNVMLGEHWVHPEDSNSSVTVINVFPSDVFGQEVQVKVLKYIGAGGLTEIDRFWAEEYGELTSVDFDGEVLSSLNGCIIDGIAYGDTSFYVVSVQDENALIEDYNLYQNYPNPFNPTTTISFSTPRAGLVSLKVFDILGKEVATLVNERKIAGSYSVDFDASDLPSGIYVYKLTSGKFSDAKKLILLK